MNTLSSSDKKRLDGLFAIAQDRLDSYVEAGTALAQVKKLGGYSKVEWDAVCKQKLLLYSKPLSGRHADRLIAAAKQAMQVRLGPNRSQVPANEYQSRALSRLPSYMRGPALETISAGGKVTVERIEELL